MSYRAKEMAIPSKLTQQQLDDVVERHSRWLRFNARRALSLATEREDEEMGARANLEHADLSGLNLENCNLAKADLRCAQIEGVNFSGANLWLANLESAVGRYANFFQANLSQSNLSRTLFDEADFSSSSLIRADLRGASLLKANCALANCVFADLFGADLRGASFITANFTQANLQNAKLSGSNLFGALLLETDLRGADLRACQVHGAAVWDVRLEGANQSNLVITKGEPHVQVDDIEVAQFIYLLLNRHKLRNVLTTLGDKAVLILGRFAERKEFLDALGSKIRRLGYLPIIFDFERPTNRDLEETIKILAGLSLFVIADITKPSSVPFEIHAIVPNYMVPFVTIQQRGEAAFSMFDDLPRKYDWALPLLKYDTDETLLTAFERKIVGPALAKLEDVRRRKACPPAHRSAEDEG